MLSQPLLRGFRVLTFLVLLAGPLALLSGADEMRTWSDKSGKHKIEAKLKEVVDGKVTLIRKDGSEMEIPLKKLCDDDQKYITEHEADEDPFKVKSDDDQPAANDGEMDSDDADKDKPEKGAGGGKSKSSSKKITTVEPNWSKAENIGTAASAETWKLSVSAAPADGPHLKARAVPTPPDVDHEHQTETVISPSAAHALVGSIVNGRGGRNHTVTHHERRTETVANGTSSHTHSSSVTRGGSGSSDEDATTKLALCDLAKGKVLGTGTMAGKFIPLAVDEGGTRALMREDKFGFDVKALELWDLTTSGPKVALRWWPAFMGEKNGEIKWGAFLSDDRVVTLSKSGSLVIWKAKTGQPIAYLQIGGDCDPAFTADRRYLIFGANQRIGVLDVNAAEVVAEMPSESLHSACFAISPDGTRFACVSFGRLSIWSFSDGTRQQQIPLTGTNAGRELVWPHEKYLLLGNSRLFDIENQVVFWNYRGAHAAWMAGPFCVFQVNPLFKNPGALVLAHVPPPNFEQILDKAMQAPDFFVLSPGTTVKLNVDGVPDPTEREKIRTALTEKLKANECQVGADGTIELSATVEAKSVEQAFRKLGRVPETSARVKSYQLQEFTTRVAFVYQGKPAWQGGRPSVSPTFSGQKLVRQSRLRCTKRRNQTMSFLARVTLPKKLMKPMPEGALGSSNVTSAGVQ